MRYTYMYFYIHGYIMHDNQYKTVCFYVCFCVVNVYVFFQKKHTDRGQKLLFNPKSDEEVTFDTTLRGYTPLLDHTTLEELTHHADPRESSPRIPLLPSIPPLPHSSEEVASVRFKKK